MESLKKSYNWKIPVKHENSSATQQTQQGNIFFWSFVVFLIFFGIFEFFNFFCIFWFFDPKRTKQSKIPTPTKENTTNRHAIIRRVL